MKLVSIKHYMHS